MNLNLIKSHILKLFPEERSKLLIENIYKSSTIKIINAIITLALIPASLKLVNKETFGVWLTISSVITWLNIFDLGLTTGLTNRISEEVAKNNIKLIKIYLSTSYAILASFIILISILFTIAFHYLNWNKVFNTSFDKKTLEQGIILTYISFCLLFLLKPISSLLMAKQKHFLNNIIYATANILTLILILFAGKYFINSFIFLIISFSFVLPFILYIFSIYLYSKEFKFYSPSIRNIELKYLKPLFGISLKFFIIQLSLIALLTSNNFIISHLLNNESVTTYNITYRLYSIISIIQLMLLLPLWTAFTNAYMLKDFAWIKNIITRLKQFNLILASMLILIFLMHKYIFRIWLGPSAETPFVLNFLLMIYFMVVIYFQIYIYLINGTGRLNLQTLYSCIVLLIHLPLAYFIIKYLHFGLEGLVLLNIFWSILGTLLWKWQFTIIISAKSTKSIWN